MRLPDHVPTIEEIVLRKQNEVFGALADRRYVETLRRLAADYRHWNKVRFIARDQGLDPEVLWVHLKLARTTQFRSTPFRGADGSPVQFTVPDVVSRELHLLDQETAGRVATDPDARMPSRSQREAFVMRAFMEEAIASSLLEGAATTRQEARKMIRAGRAPRTTGERMVMNNYQAILFIREHASTPMSPEFMLELQGMLTEKTLDHADQVGRFRTEQDAVRVEDAYGNILFQPPPVHELSQRISVLCDFANQPDADPFFIHPVIRACLLHFQVAVDHPFCDGNGRTARAIFYWYLLRHRYWLFEYMPISTMIRESPAKYALSYLYAETDHYDATYFLMYNARVLARARASMNANIRKKIDEQRRAASLLYADTDLNLRQRQVLLRYTREPDRHVTIQSHAAEFRISYQTARADLQGLEARHYLHTFRDGKAYVFIRGPRLSEVQSE